ncbi:MAG: AAA family ATPase [Armatimonadota bacterium]|nr:AAA family ATPase [Armatimonadota bacterium]MDR7519507.1 AAA family ATPase [Armatimonadota bacterium]MDR7550202.1 AAA family ATPase [Armatimonadota bacterium]
MPYVLAVAGKGGTGKTTLAGLIVRSWLRTGRTPVLAVDADPNTNLDVVLGLHPSKTISDVLDATKGMRDVPSTMPRTTYLQYHLEECLCEGRGVDLIVMGRPEGAGCYCAANHLLREHLDRLMSSYPYVVMDNEAGMEHLSRRTTRDVDLLLIVSDPTLAGLKAARRIQGLVGELNLAVREIGLVINRADGLPPAVEHSLLQDGLRVVGTVPEDPLVVACELEGRPLLDLPDDAPSARAVGAILSSTQPAAVGP